MNQPHQVKIVLWTTALTVSLACIFLTITFWGRRQDDLEFQKKAQSKEMEAMRRFRAAYPDDLKISGFIVSPPEIHRGEEALFCYGVLNAKVVRLEPPIDSVHPALSYCFTASPKKTTTFTLTAEDGHGKSVKQSATVTVK